MRQKTLSLLAFILLASFVVFAQGPDPVAGNLPFATQVGGPYDFLDLATSNILIAVPLRAKNEKIPFSFALYGNSYMYTYPNPANHNVPQWYIGTAIAGTESSQITLTSSSHTITCPNGEGNDEEQYAFVITDSSGAAHPLPSNVKIDDDGCDPSPVTGVTTDDSGYTMQIAPTSQGAPYFNFYVWTRSGLQVYNNGTGVVTDPDGTTESYNKNTGVYTDSLGTQAMKAALGGGGGASDTYTYTGGDGSPSDGATVSYTEYHQLTVFGCPNKTDINSTAYLPSAISVVGLGTFQLTYETTPGYSGQTDPSGLSYVTGRIGTITYPSGGSVSYSYAGGNSGINCSNLVVPTLTRSVYDSYSKTTSKWSYVNNDASGIFNFTVVETDPAGNQAIHSFSTEYETLVQSYQGGCPKSTNGCNGGGTELQYVTTCYNVNVNSGLGGCQTPSAAPTLPITQTDVYTWVGMSSQSLTETIYDCKTVTPCYGLATEVKKYDYGAPIPPSGTPLSDTTIAYNSGSSCGTLDSYIYDRACSVTTNAEGAQVAQTNYTYNAGGHPTQTQQWVSGSNYLTSSATYGTNGAATGVLSSTTDVNNATTSYLNFTCNSMVPTTVNYPLSLSASMSWDSGCNGAVLVSSTDVNQKQTNYTYNDPLWRLRSVTDPLGYVTSTNYSAAGTLPVTVENSLNFPTSNPTSTVDNLYTLDGLGRLAESEKRTAPGATTFDNTILYTYGWTPTGTVTGPFTTQTIPGGSAVTTTQFDALGRATSVTDGGGGTLTSTYADNDVVQALGPPPSNENSKQVQNQYDGIGRVTYSCQISTTVSGKCGENANSSTTGVLTTTSYSSATGSQTISSVRGSQTRSKTVDGLGRVTVSTTPEGGTIYYYYDTVPSFCNAVAVPGKLIGFIYANGNTSCYLYDSLGRTTVIGATSASATMCRRFAYDNSTGVLGSIPNGISISNPYGRMVEAETDNCSVPLTPITDE
jgi:hypothetical protein